MNETWLGTIPLIGTIILAIGCWWYMWGGRSGKWKRRFVGAFLVATAVWVEALILGVFNWWMLALYPLVSFMFHLGYGTEIPFLKIIKRSIIVAVSLIIGVGFCALLGGKSWLVLGVHGLVATGSIILGAKNPVPAAPEEFFVCLLLTECMLMYPYVTQL